MRAMEKSFDAAEAEPRILEKWDAANAFAAGANAKPGADPFCIMIPPPNVTGSLHMGHAFNNTLQDILVRWHRMRGFDTLWQPGTDHAGIATQMVTEREMAANGEETRQQMGRERFLDRVWQQKVKSRGTIIGQLKRLGASCDWSREAFTMGGAKGDPEAGTGPNFHDAVIKVFVEMYNNGYIYRGKRLVNWDPHFETAISDLEVEQVEVDGKMWRLRYTLNDGETYDHPVELDEEGNPTDWETRDYLTVATTRPETMLGDTGIAVHPEDRRYAHLIGKTVTLPICGRSIPIVADDYADPEKGTGAVKITPAHDFNDMEVGKRTGLAAINVMTTRAAMFLRDNADFAEGCPADMIGAAIERYDGLGRYEARDAIVTEARDNGWLDGIDEDRHMVPHGDRSKVAIEPYLTDQWFVDAEKIVGPALDAVRKGMAAHEAGEFDENAGYTRILPERDAKTYFHWLENIEPWCISRQLWWGHQIPVWFDDWGNEFCAASESEAFDLAKAFHEERNESARVFVHSTPDSVDNEDLEGRKRAATAQVGSSETGDIHVFLGRDPDVLDTWFSSGLWPIGTLGWPEETPELNRYFPTSTLITGFDIIFFWVARMMMMQLRRRGPDPVPHRLCPCPRARREGQEDVQVAWQRARPAGPDRRIRRRRGALHARRHGRHGPRPEAFDKDRIAGYRNFGTKLWNAARFAEMNGVQTGAGVRTGGRRARPSTAGWWARSPAPARSMTRRLMPSASTTRRTRFTPHVWGKVCDWYVEFAKPLFAPETRRHRSRKPGPPWPGSRPVHDPAAPVHALRDRGALGPDRAARDTLLVHADWPAYGEDLDRRGGDREMGWVIGLIEEIRSVRAQMHVPAGLNLPLLQADWLDRPGSAALDRNAALILRLARVVGPSRRVDKLPKGAVTIPVEGGSSRCRLPTSSTWPRKRRGWTRCWASSARSWAACAGGWQPQIRRKRPRGRGRGNPRKPCRARRGRGQAARRVWRK